MTAPVSPSRIELGGGRTPREGFYNVDRRPLPEVQHCCDLESDPLPFADDSVEEVYSAHCLEHLRSHHHVLHEIVRVCRVGARVEIRVPYWLQSMSMCWDHACTISPAQVRHWATDFVQDWFGGCTKRLKLLRTEYVPGETFNEAKDLFSWLSDDQVMRLIPDACHEVRFYFEVATNEACCEDPPR